MSLFEANFEETKRLLQQGKDPNAKTKSGYTVLMNALVRCQFDIAKLLLNSGADINAKDSDGFTALMTASCYGRLETVKFLIEAGADVSAKNYNGDTALDSGRIEVGNFLFQNIALSQLGCVIDVPADYICPICRCYDGSNVVQLKNCVHKFHTECITPWCERVQECPMCRAPVIN